MLTAARENTGQSLLLLLVLVAALALLTAAALPLGQHIYRVAAAEREAETLLANLRYLQALDGQYNSHLPEQDWPVYPQACLELHRDGYVIFAGGDTAQQKLIEHQAMPGVSYKVTADSSYAEPGSYRVTFQPTGEAKEVGLVFYISCGEVQRKIIVTIDGRCRVDKPAV